MTAYYLLWQIEFQLELGYCAVHMYNVHFLLHLAAKLLWIILFSSQRMHVCQSQWYTFLHVMWRRVHWLAYIFFQLKDDSEGQSSHQQVPRVFVTFHVYHTYQLRAYLYQARDMYGSDKSGLSGMCVDQPTPLSATLFNGRCQCFITIVHTFHSVWLLPWWRGVTSQPLTGFWWHIQSDIENCESWLSPMAI